MDYYPMDYHPPIDPQRPGLDERFGSALFDQVCEWLGENTEPEMVHSFEALVDWADRNGFVPAADTPESGPGRDM